MWYILERDDATDLHHGDCIGADEEIDDIARRAGYRMHLHVPEKTVKQARCLVRSGHDVIYPPRPYLVRNHDIVDAVGTMIATPGEETEQRFSGTWSTVRYTRKQGVPLFIVFPDGTVMGL